jgi:large subunit ribosomal protein L1
MPTRSALYRQQIEKTDQAKSVGIADAISQIKAMAAMSADRSYKNGKKRKKFDQSIDLVMHLGIDPKQADQMVRGSISLPKGIGKSRSVIAFCQDNDVAAAKAAGAVEAGGEALIKKIQDGWMDFDVAVAHPSMMGQVSKLGRVLGPQGKMPSPKAGTVSPDVATAVKDYSAGKLEYRNDAGGNVHATVGKVSLSDEDLKMNIEAFVSHIRKIKPTSSKGTYIKRVSLSATMTPGVALDLA